MKPALVWARRGLGPLLAAFLTVFLAWSLWRDPLWNMDAQWGTRYIGAFTALLAPLVASVVAYEQARRFHPGLAELSKSTRRGALAALLPATAVLGWVVVALGLIVIGVIATVSRAGGLTDIDPWFIPEVLAATGAVVALGLAVGSLVEGYAAPILAASLGLVAPLLVSLVSTDLAGALFGIAHSEGTSLGLERVPSAAATAISTHCAIIVAGVIIACLGARPSPRRTSVVAATSIPIVIALAAQASTFPATGTFRPSHESLVCVGSAPEVCAPSRAARLMVPVQRDFATVVSALDGSRLALPTRLTYARMGTNGWTDNSANLSFNFEDLRDGHLPKVVLVEYLTMPRPCAALFDTAAGDTQAYLERQVRVRQWMLAQIETPTHLPAPAGVRADYQALLDCPVTKINP